MSCLAGIELIRDQQTPEEDYLYSMWYITTWTYDTAKVLRQFKIQIESYLPFGQEDYKICCRESTKSKRG